jgi:anti-sigma factor RsiW
MKCKHARKRISQYLDDELVLDEKEAFALHIRDCAACRVKLEETRAIHKMFANAERFSAPYGFSTRVLANLEEESTWLRILPSFKSFFLRSAEVAFALAVITIGIVSGNLLLEDKMPVHRQVQESFSLDLFQATPPDSIGGIYLAYAGGTR